VALIAALGATTPNPRGFTVLALVAAPITTVLSGALEFVVLDGTDAFPLLAIGLGPVVVGSALLMTSKNLLWSGLGRANLSFSMLMLAPSNPQTYNPQTFLFTSIFIIAGAALLLVAQTLIPPISDNKRRMRLVAGARSELKERGRSNGEAPEEATFRDASRIEQFLAAGGAKDSRALAEILSCFDQSAMLRLCSAELTQFADGPLAPLADEARTAIVKRDVASLRAIAPRFRDQAPRKDSAEADIAACLILTSNILEQGCSDVCTRKAP
jgi:hypothetical protein